MKTFFKSVVFYSSWARGLAIDPVQKYIYVPYMVENASFYLLHTFQRI